MPKYYVYSLSRPDGSVFYVGKGQGARIDQHEQDAKRGATGPRFDVIRQIWAEGFAVQKAILLETEDESEALQTEIRIIAEYGRDTLVNSSNGGEGKRQPTEPRVLYRTTLTLPTHLMEKLECLAYERGQTISAMIGGWVFDLPEPSA